MTGVRLMVQNRKGTFLPDDTTTWSAGCLKRLASFETLTSKSRTWGNSDFLQTTMPCLNSIWAPAG